MARWCSSAGTAFRRESALITDRELARLALDAYHQPPNWAVGEIHARMTTPEDLRVVAFRGTTIDPRTWIRDLDAGWVFHPQLGMLHRGFLGAALAIYPQLQWPRDDRRLILVGHSLGGAIALVVGALMITSDKPVAAVVTFGAPRVGMSDFCGVLQAAEVRQYRHGNDPVPTVPLPPYRHVREPLIAIDAETSSAVECHRLAGYIEGLNS